MGYSTKSIFAASGGPKIRQLREYVDQRLVLLRTDRWSWWQHWRQLSDFILPRRGRYLTYPNQASRGDPLGSRIINETPMLAHRTLAAGLMAGLTSPARPWFRLSIRDFDSSDNTQVKLWLDEVTRRIRVVLSQSNAYNALHVIYEELGCFGTGCMMIEEDFDDVVRCHTLTAGEYYLASSYRDEIDTLYREYVLTTGQVVERFGIENCSPQVRSLWMSGQLDKEVRVAQAIEPNDDRAPQVPGLKGRKFRSIIWEWGQNPDLVLDLRGYYELPFAAPRWSVIMNDSYGRGPGMDALASSKMLQQLEKRTAQAIDKVLNPPMVADVSMKNEPASLLPGGVTYVANMAQSGFKPAYQVPPDIRGAQEKINECEQRIDKAFFADLFLMISQLDTVRTATEIIERKQEKMLMLGPFLERSQFELINPMIERVFAVMYRARLIPPAPREIAGSHFDIECISTLADAQRSTATTGIERLMAFAGNLAAAYAGRPDNPLDNINTDEVVREYADLLGVTQKLIVAQQQRDAIRRTRLQQVRQVQAAQVAMAAAQGAKTLSEADVGGGQNALQMMLGNAPEAQQ
ncbi:MAG: portal protein [Deltaproteobacteria bacterium]|nr:portal protein [Deltaproteobacteria bacterium]MDA8308255.1 portal protein [Deltaproteobacteria bacterium]